MQEVYSWSASRKFEAICRGMTQFITRYALGKWTVRVKLARIFEDMLSADKGDELRLRALRSLHHYDAETFDFLIECANTEPESEIAKLMFRLGLWHPSDCSAADLE
jgi:hypothetical protein